MVDIGQFLSRSCVMAAQATIMSMSAAATIGQLFCGAASLTRGGRALGHV
jgi:hypothetical protein